MVVYTFEYIDGYVQRGVSWLAILSQKIRPLDYARSCFRSRKDNTPFLFCSWQEAGRFPFLENLRGFDLLDWPLHFEPLVLFPDKHSKPSPKFHQWWFSETRLIALVTLTLWWWTFPPEKRAGETCDDIVANGQSILFVNSPTVVGPISNLQDVW